MKFQAFDALVAEHVTGVRQQINGFTQAVSDHRHGNIEFQQTANAAESAEGDARVIANHAARHHHDAFANDRVDLAGHDAAAGLRSREHEFSKSAAWPTTKPANVIGDLAQTDCDGLEHATCFHHAVAGGLRFEVVGRFSKGDAQFLTENCTDRATEFWICVDACSDRGATDRQVARENVARQFGACNGVGNGCCVAAKFLADADGRSVH